MFKPMLCKLGEKRDLGRKNYIAEPKLDGTRAIAYVDKKIKIINRRNRDITHRYPEFKFKINAKNCILDGEIICYDKKSMPNFNLLQKREQLEKKFLIELRSKQYPATYVVFDILRKDGKDLANLPLLERKKILEQTVKGGRNIETIFYTTKIRELWNKIRKADMEGIVIKRKDSRYLPGTRSDAWIKIKNLKTIDAVIIGYTHEKRIISALAIGIYSKGKLKYIGRVGTGFTEEFLEELYEMLRPLKQKKATVKYEGRKEIHWVKPKIVAEIRYLEFSKDMIMRVPAFLRLRFDKEAKECILEEQI